MGSEGEYMRLAALFLAFALTAAPSALAQNQIPVDAFGRLPAVADAGISPDGRRVALATTNAEGASIVLVVDLENTSSRQGYAVGEGQQLRGIAWVDNQRIAYEVTQTFHANSVLPDGFRWRGGSPGRVDYQRNGVINVATNNAVTLTTNPRNAWADYGSTLIAPIAGDPGYGRLIGRSDELVENPWLVVYRVALDTGRTWRDSPNGINAETVRYLLDDAGNVVARFDSNRQTNRWRIYVYEGAEPRLLFEDVSGTGEPLRLVGLLPNGNLVAIDDNDSGFAGLYSIDRRTGQGELLFGRPNGDVNSAILDPWTRQVVGASYSEAETHQTYFDPAIEAVREALASSGQGDGFRIVSWSQDRRRFVIYMERGLDGGAYYLYEAGQMRLLSARYPDLRRANPGERQSITYRARDGHQIPAYLTLPAGVEHRNLPLVVLVHGGPHGVRDTMAFDYEAAFLASRGYAVLQPNFRGSGGYGAAFEQAGMRQWGGLMQTDVEDGAAAVIRSGIADGSRMCIVGSSYGGYAALAGATLTPDRYRCAVSVAGVSDLNMMLSDIARQTRSGSSQIDWWTMSIGDRADDAERIRAASPANLADRVQIPILLMHGTDDTVVPIDQSRRMQRALQNAGKNVRFVELRGDDHWISDSSTRQQVMREMETFLAQHLGAAPAQPPAPASNVQ